MRHAFCTTVSQIIIFCTCISSLTCITIAEFSFTPDKVQASSCGQQQQQPDKSMEEPHKFEKTFDKEELKNRLTPMQYHCTQERGTERAFTGELYTITDDGNYHCVVCDNILFKSDTKFDSGSGWPSFYDMAEQGSVKMNEDTTHGMKRVETVCNKCGAHLGHVFEDGPSEKTGQRFCINSSSLKFNPKKK